MSVSKAAELLDTSAYDVYRLAESRGLRLGGTAEQYMASVDLGLLGTSS